MIKNQKKLAIIKVTGYSESMKLLESNRLFNPKQYGRGRSICKDGRALTGVITPRPILRKGDYYETVSEQN